MVLSSLSICFLVFIILVFICVVVSTFGSSRCGFSISGLLCLFSKSIKIYTGKVVSVQDFGCFVKLWEGCEGFLHVSQIANERVEKPSDVLSVGDEVIVKATGYDKKGKLNLSRKEALPKPKKEETKVE